MVYVQTNIAERCRSLGEWILANNGTVRSAAQRFGVSKSTVHKDVTERLQEIDRPLYLHVRAVLDVNKAERHLRGGDATRRKYRSETPQI